MDLQEARDRIFRHLTDVTAEVCDDFDYEKWALKEALEYIVDHLDKELKEQK